MLLTTVSQEAVLWNGAPGGSLFQAITTCTGINIIIKLYPENPSLLCANNMDLITTYKKSIELI